MSTHDYSLSNQSGASFRSDLNNALAAILSNNSNASSPSTTVAYMIWVDTNANKLKIRNSANDDWVDLINLDGSIARDITLTGASANIVFDQSDNALEFADNAKAVFGTGSDLTISHDGSNSIINDAGTGELQLQRAGNTILSLGSTGIEITDPNGAAEVKLTGFEGSSAQVTLIADEGDDNADTWTIQSFVTDNTLRFLSKASGSLVEKWHITTDGKVEQTGDLLLPSSRIGVGLTPQTSDVATNVSAGLIQTDANIDIRYAGTNTDPAGARYLNLINTDTTLVANQPMGGIHWIGNDSDAPSNINCSFTAINSGSGGASGIFLFKTGGSERMRLTHDGALCIGVTAKNASGNRMTVHDTATMIHLQKLTTSNSSCFNVIHERAVSSTKGNLFVLRNSTGTSVGGIKITNTATEFNTTSDYRLKENVVAISDGITRLKTLKPSKFNWIADSTNTPVDGFIAHEVSSVVPEAISGEKDAVITQALIDSGDAPDGEIGDPIYQEIDQSKIVPLLTAALQEAIAKIETLETKVAALEAA